MQAGRELDVKVAEVLGWKPYLDEDFPDWATEGHGWVPHFSTKWAGMGVLVEEAREQGILISIDPAKSRTYCASAIDEDGEDHMAIRETAPYAVCVAFLKAKGVEMS